MRTGKGWTDHVYVFTESESNPTFCAIPIELELNLGFKHTPRHSFLAVRQVASFRSSKATLRRPTTIQVDVEVCVSRKACILQRQHDVIRMSTQNDNNNINNKQGYCPRDWFSRCQGLYTKQGTSSEWQVEFESREILMTKHDATFSVSELHALFHNIDLLNAIWYI